MTKKNAERKNSSSVNFNSNGSLIGKLSYQISTAIGKFFYKYVFFISLQLRKKKFTKNH